MLEVYVANLFLPDGSNIFKKDVSLQNRKHCFSINRQQNGLYINWAPLMGKSLDTSENYDGEC